MTRTRPRSRQWLALLISSAVSVMVAWWIWERVQDARSGDTVVVVDNSEELRAALNARADGGGAEPIGTEGFPPPLLRTPLDEVTARVFFKFVGDGRPFDPYFFYAHKPSVDIEYRFPEHPDGSYRIQTNSIGMREADEVRADAPSVRILVTGDSHSDGVCANDESYTSRLEATLAEDAAEGEVVEALNHAVYGYSMYQYLGVLERYAELEPDVFVATVYGGNDFYSLMSLQRYFHHREAPHMSRPTPYEKIIAADEDLASGIVAQELGQIQYFLDNPEDVEIAAATACAIIAEMERVSAEHGIRLLLVYLPPPSRAQPEQVREELEPYLSITGIDPSALAMSDRIADRWLSFARSRGIECLDLRPVMAAYDDRLYYRSDHHLNVRGHEVVADALVPVLRRILP